MFSTSSLLDNNSNHAVTSSTKLILDEKIIRRYEKFKIFFTLISAVFHTDESPETAEYNKTIIQLKSQEHVRELLILSILLETKKLEISTSNSSIYDNKNKDPNKDTYVKLAKKIIASQSKEDCTENVYQLALSLKRNSSIRYENLARKINIFFLQKPLTDEKATVAQWFRSENYPFDLEKEYALIVNKLTSPNPEVKDEALCKEFINTFSKAQYERLEFVMKKSEDLNYRVKHLGYYFFVGSWFHARTRMLKQPTSAPPSPTLLPKNELNELSITELDKKSKKKKSFFSRRSQDPLLIDTTAGDLKTIAKEILKKLSQEEAKSEVMSELNIHLINYFSRMWGLKEVSKNKKKIEKERKKLQGLLSTYFEEVKKQPVSTHSPDYDSNTIAHIREHIANIDNISRLGEKPRSDSLQYFDYNTFFLEKQSDTIIQVLIDDFTIACIEQLIKISLDDLRETTLREDNPVLALNRLLDRFTFFFEEMIINFSNENLEYVHTIINNLLRTASLCLKINNGKHKVRANYLLSYAIMLIFNQIAVSRLLPFLQLSSKMKEKILELETMFDSRKNYQNYRQAVKLKNQREEAYIPLISVSQREFISRKDNTDLISDPQATSQEKFLAEYKTNLQDIGSSFIKLQSRFTQVSLPYCTNFMNFLLTKELFDLPNPISQEVETTGEVKPIPSPLKKEDSFNLSHETDSYSDNSYESSSFLFNPKIKPLQKNYSLDSTESNNSGCSLTTFKSDGPSNKDLPELLTLKEWKIEFEKILHEKSDEALTRLKNQFPT